MTLQEKRDKRATLITQCRALITRADEAKRPMNADEQRQYDEGFRDAAALKTEIERGERLDAEERELASSAGRRTEATPPGETRGKADAVEIEFRGKPIRFDPGTLGHAIGTDAYQRDFRRYMLTGRASELISGEQRTAAFAANDVNADGGYLHAPVQFNAILLKFLDNMVFIRQRATVYPVTTSDTLGTPTLDTDVTDATWTAEITGVTIDAAAQIGRRDLKPNQLAKLIKVSQKLLATAAISPEEIVAQRMAYKLAVTEEKGYLTGTGTTQPLGVYTASASGVPTSQDVVAGTTTALTADGLISVKYKLAAQYRGDPSTRWNFHRDAVANISKLKDSQSRYLWQLGLMPGQPDTLLGLPIDESEYTPNTFTTGLYVGGLFCWRFYWIADLITGFEMQRLNELYAVTSQVGFIGRKWADGAPTVPAAFARAILA